MFSVFKTLTEQVVTVELKNDLCVQGTLKSVDQCVIAAGTSVSDPGPGRDGPSASGAWRQVGEKG